MNDEIKQIKESFSMVMSAYFSYFQIEPVDVEIICTEKIATIYKQKRPDLFEGEYPIHPEDVGRILRTFKIKKNVEVTDNGKDNF